jgi:DNA-binding winged helix-turn-helix (wHTH) protein/TolB-like protein/Flp pilus assembly protein TadD
MFNKNKEFYEFGEFRIDVAERVLLQHGKPVLLPPKAFGVLLVLVQNQGRIVEKEELMQTVWQDTFVEEVNVARGVSDLRKLLGDTRANPRFIETIAKRGYRFIANVREVSDESPASQDQDGKVISFTPSLSNLNSTIPGESAVEIQKSGNLLLVQPNTNKDETQLIQDSGGVLPFQTPQPVTNSSRQTLKIVAISLLALVVIGGLILYLLPKRTAPQFTAKSIAVLPFKTISSDTSDHELEQGMTYTLIAKLGNIKQITVRPISAVSKYATSEQDALAIGRELQTQAVLAGSVQKLAGQVRVTVQFMDTSDGRLIWSEQFDEKATDIFKLQDSISERVVQGLAIKINEEERQHLVKHSTENTKAYELYVKGWYHLAQGTEESGFKALENFTQAITIDPNYAPAYAGLADVYTVASDVVLAPDVAMAKAREHAQKALELDNALDEAHLTMARVKWLADWDWKAAEAEFKRAIELNPSLMMAHQEYGLFLAQQAKFEEAIAQMKIAQEIDPLSVKARYHLGWIFYCNHQWDHAIEIFHEALGMDANSATTHRRLGLALAQKGAYEEAISELKKSLEIIDDSGCRADLGYVYALAGKKKEAMALLNQLLEQAKRQYISPYYAARIYSGLQDKERLFQALEKTYEIRSDHLTQLQTDPIFSNWHSEPRFAELIHQVGFTNETGSGR